MEETMIARLERAREKAAAAAKAEKMASMIPVNDPWDWGRRSDDVPFNRESVTDTPDLLMTLSVYCRLFDAFLESDDDTAREILRQMKDKLAGFRSLPPLFEESGCSRSIRERNLAKKTYELAVVMSVLNVDHDAFESDFSLLRPYYIDKRVGDIGLTGQEYALVHFNLLRLLVHNRIAEFHVELESFAAAATTEQFPRPFFMEEIKPEYDCVFTERQVLNFVLRPKDRHKISQRMKAVQRLRMKEMVLSLSEQKRMKARRMMLSLLKQQLSEYMKEHPEWEMKNGCVVFSERGAEEETSKHCKVMMQLINETLGYARGLKQLDTDESRGRFVKVF